MSAFGPMTRDVVDIMSVQLGPLLTNSYIVREIRSKTCWVFDPGMEPRPLISVLAREELDVQRILITHGHGDHIAGIPGVLRAYPRAVLTAPAGDAYMLGDPEANLSGHFGVPVTCPQPGLVVHPGDRLDLGTLEWTVLNTAGHTPGGVSWYCAGRRGHRGRCTLCRRHRPL